MNLAATIRINQDAFARMSQILRDTIRDVSIGLMNEPSNFSLEMESRLSAYIDRVKTCGFQIENARFILFVLSLQQTHRNMNI